MALKVGGTLFSEFEPIWGTGSGSHIWFDDEINNTNMIKWSLRPNASFAVDEDIYKQLCEKHSPYKRLDVFGIKLLAIKE